MSDRYEAMDIYKAIERGFVDERTHNNSDYYWVCVDTARRVVVCADGGQPEDATLYRDFKPLVDELNRLAREVSS